MTIPSSITGKHASEEVKEYCIFMHTVCGVNRKTLAKYFNKTERCIGNWIQKFYDDGDLSRKSI
jgi:transposase